MSFSGLMNKVAFVNKVPLLMKATSADPSPPAGHIYDEITRITFESLEQNDVLVEFLVDRLQKNSPYIKWKVLLIMKAVLRKGHEEFRHSLCKQSQGIQEAKSFSGPPDPLHGDTPYVNVRETAGEVLQFLFDTDWTNHETKKSSRSSVKMEGFGSSNFGGASDNNRSRQESSQTSWDLANQATNLISYAVQRVKDNISYTFNENVNAIAKYQQQEVKGDDGYHQVQDTERKLVTRPSQTFNLLGNSSGSKDEYLLESSEGLNHFDLKQLKTTEQPPIMASESQNRYPSPDDSPVKQENEHLSQEVSAVEKITAPGGIRLNPGRSELQDFIKKCEMLNFERIVELLDGKLQNSDYRVQMKALFVIENLLHSNVSNSQDVITSKLISRFQTLSSSNQTAVRNKSTKLLHMLQPQQTKPGANNQVHKEDDEKQSKDSQLVDLLSEMDVSSSSKNEAKPQGIATVDLMASLMDEATLQETGRSKAAAIVEGQSSNSFDLLTSKVSPNQGTNVNESQSSCDILGQRSRDLLDLDPFSSLGSMVSSTPSDPSLTELSVNKEQSVGNSSNATKDSNLNFDPFSVDFGRAACTESNAGMTSNQASAKSGFNFIMEDQQVQDSSFKQTVHLQSSPIQPHLLQPTINQQHLTNTRQYPSQPVNMNQRWPSSNQGSFSQLNFNPATPMMAMAPRSSVNVVNRPRPAVTNGFDFISSNKKPGAFDFVKDAMEASKRK